MSKIQSCAVLGCFPWRFAWGFDEQDGTCGKLKLELAQQIMALRQMGVLHFSIACDPGPGLYAAEIINSLREQDPELMLFCIVPYEEWTTKWPPYLRERYFSMLERCTCMTTACRRPSDEALFIAYCRIIDQSDMVLAVWPEEEQDGSSECAAICYAEQKKRPILFIHPDTRSVTVRTYQTP